MAEFGALIGMLLVGLCSLKVRRIIEQSTVDRKGKDRLHFVNIGMISIAMVILSFILFYL